MSTDPALRNDVVTVSDEPPPLLVGRGIVKHFSIGADASVRAVDDVDIYVQPGETLGLVGESGCGKSTLARCLIRLIEPTEGQVEFDGRDITHLKQSELRALRRAFQIVFQDPASSLDPRAKVREILLEGLNAHRIGSRADRRERVEAIVEQVGLSPDVLERYPRDFSGGQQQRIGIARALVLEPKLLIADEPVASLDVSVQAQVLNLIVGLKRSLGLAVLFVAHDLAVVSFVSDRIAVMYLGRIVESGTVAEVMSSPMHPYTVGLLAAIPDPVPGRQATMRPPIRGDIGSTVNLPTGCRYHPRCPMSQEICTRVEPTLDQSPGHAVACHFPGSLQ